MQQPCDFHSLIERLLATPRRADRQAMLKDMAIRDCLTVSFFEAIKSWILRIRDTDLPQQELLASILNNALAITNDLRNRAMGLWGRSLAELFLGLKSDVIATSNEAMALYKQLDDHVAYGTLGANQVLVLLKMEELETADALAQEIETYLLQYGRSPALGRLYRHWALVKSDMHQPDKALAYMKLARPYIWDDGDRWRQAAFLVDIAPIHLRLDEYIEAADALEEARQYFEDKSSSDWATNAYNLAQLYEKVGRLGDALKMADEAVTVYQKYGHDPLAYARAVLRQSYILLTLNQFGQILAPLSEIEPIFIENRDREKQSEVDLLRGLALMGLGYMYQAEDLLQACIEQASPHFAYLALTARFALAQLYLAWGLADDDPIYFEMGQTVASDLYGELKEKRPIRAAEAGYLIVQFNLVTDCYAEAQQWLTHLAPIAETYAHLQTRHRNFLGQIAQRQGNWQAAHHHYEAGLQGISQIRTQLHLEALQVEAIAGQEQLYRNLIEVNLAQGHWDRVWQYSEASRAYSLTAAIAQESSLTTAPDLQQSEPLHSLMRTLYNKRAQRFALSSQLYHHLDRDMASLSPAEEAVIRHKIRHLDDDIQALYLEMSGAESNTLDPNLPLTIISIEQTAAHLPQNTLLLVYIRLTDNLLVMGIDRSGLVMQQILDTPWPQIEGALTQFVHFGLQIFQDTWENYEPHAIQQQYDSFIGKAQEDLFRLYQALWLPLAAKVAAYEHIVIVANDILHYLPFQALYSGEKYIIDDHVISYAPSVTVYHLCQQRALARQGRWGNNIILLAYKGQANTLPHVEEEINQIQQVYPQAHLLLKNQATFAHLNQKAATARILHLATHGEMSSSSPFMSYLELAPTMDGEPAHQLRVYDAAQLDLRQTDFVCLSACETGQVAERGGDVLGLQWGFMHAGAYALIANLWPVEDNSASQIMVDFYRLYRPETGKAAALRQAQLNLRQKAQLDSDSWQFAHPYFWAPFAVYGFADSVV